MDVETFLRRFAYNEGSSALRETLALIAEHPGADWEAEFNVWTLSFDAGDGLVRFRHESTPDRGEAPPDHLVRAIEERLRREGALGPPATS